MATSQLIPKDTPAINSLSVEDGKSTITATYWNLTKAHLGIGCFAMPFALTQSGVVAGTISLCIFALVCNKTFKLLVRCQHLSDRFEPSLYDLAYEAGGGSRLASLVVQYTVAIAIIGVCSAYLSLMGNLAADITDTFLGTSIPLIPPTEDELFWRHEFGMLLCAPLLLALGFARNLDNLKWTSAGGSFLVVLCLIFVVLELLSRPQYEYDPDLEAAPPPSWFTWFNPSTYPLFLSTSAVLFCGHSIAIPAAQAVQRNDRHRFFFAYDACIATVLVVSLAFSLASLWLYNRATGTNAVPGSMLDVLGKSSSNGALQSVYVVVSRMLFRLSLGLTMAFTYVLFLPLLSDVLESGLNNGRPFSLRAHATLRFSAICSTYALVYVFGGNFSMLCSLVGAVSMSLIGFVFPSAIFLGLKYKQHMHGASHYDAGEQLSMFDIVFNLSAVVVGLVVLATGVFSVFSTAT